MKKTVFILLLPMFLFATDLSKKFGFEFYASSSPEIGFKYHANSVYTINPSVTFLLDFSYGYYDDYFGDYYSDSDVLIGVSFDQQFYLRPREALNPYIYLDISMTDLTNPYPPDFGVGYGLQYQFNDYFGAFGEFGLFVSPWFEQFGINRSGVGLVLYVR